MIWALEVVLFISEMEIYIIYIILYAELPYLFS